jgi:hypothetical protein
MFSEDLLGSTVVDPGTPTSTHPRTANGSALPQVHFSPVTVFTDAGPPTTDEHAGPFVAGNTDAAGVHASCEGSPPTTGALFSAWREVADGMRDGLGDALSIKPPHGVPPVERSPGTSNRSLAEDAEPQLDIHGLKELGPLTSVVETVTDTPRPSITATLHAPTTDAPSVEEPGAGVDPRRLSTAPPIGSAPAFDEPLRVTDGQATPSPVVFVPPPRLWALIHRLQSRRDHIYKWTSANTQKPSRHWGQRGSCLAGTL